MKILFIHQNFPGQFLHLAPALVRAGHGVSALSLQRPASEYWQGVKLYGYKTYRSSTQHIHPWLSDFETKIIRAEACFGACLEMKRQGYVPDVVVAHHGWGESLFIKDVWPQCRVGIYCEFFYKDKGADVNFDPEFSAVDPAEVCRLRLKNLNNALHFDFADKGLSPTYWQRSTFPEGFSSKITVVHDGIDTDRLIPLPQAEVGLPDGSTAEKGDELVTFVNRNLEPYRGYHTFMRGVPKILRERPGARVLIVGGNDVSYGFRPKDGRTWRDIFLDEIRPQLSESESSRIHFLGNVSYEKFVEVMRVSTVHVYLTYPFVLSWSLLEAMSLQCAIVASATQPVTEVLRDDENGVLCNFFDHETMAEKVCTLLRDPARRERLGQRARADVVQSYDLKSVCLPGQVSWVESLYTDPI